MFTEKLKPSQVTTLRAWLTETFDADAVDCIAGDTKILDLPCERPRLVALSHENGRAGRLYAFSNGPMIVSATRVRSYDGGETFERVAGNVFITAAFETYGHAPLQNLTLGWN